VPDVVVPSVYVPLELAVHVPLTVRDPEIVTFLQLFGSRPADEISRLLPLKVRHDELTAQVPTALPPQAVRLEQDAVAPPPLELPPVLVAPPLAELPPDVGELPELEPELHAAEISPNAITIVRAVA
jgi:hypothetical protein